MGRVIEAVELDARVFAPFGDVLDFANGPDFMINEGMCGRHHDRAGLNFGTGRAAISLFDAIPRSLPYRFNLMERHPLGSQAFVPMTAHGFLVITAPDEGGIPGQPLAFLTAPGQAINIHAGTWHGVLTPLAGPGYFAVIDRVGDGNNLEEYRFDQEWTVVAGQQEPEQSGRQQSQTKGQLENG